MGIVLEFPNKLHVAEVLDRRYVHGHRVEVKILKSDYDSFPFDKKTLFSYYGGKFRGIPEKGGMFLNMPDDEFCWVPVKLEK